MIDRRILARFAGGFSTAVPAVAAIFAIILSISSAFGRRTARRWPQASWAAARGTAGPRASGKTETTSFRLSALLVGLGALVISVPTALAHGSTAALGMGLQATVMLAIMIVARAWWTTGQVDRRAVAQGITVGLVLLACASLLDAAGWVPAAFAEALGWSSFPGRATLWHGHPNVLATAAVLPTLAALAWGDRVARLVSGTAAIVLVTATGSRTVLAVLILLGTVSIVQSLLRRTSGARVSVRLVTGIATASVVMVLLVTFTTVFDRFDPRLVLAPEPPTINLLYASEDLRAGSWSHLGIAIRKVGPAPGVRGDSVWAIEKTDTAWWSRVQQGVTLAPGATVTLQLELRQPDPAARPGIHARREGPDGPVEVTVQRRDGRWTVEAVRGVALVDLTVVDIEDWTSLAVTITNPTAVPLPLAFGLAPDQQSGTSGTTMWVRRPQVVFGEPVGYQPTRASAIDSRTSLGTWSDRAKWARLGWEGFAERPWFGQGPNAFAAYTARRSSTREQAPPGTTGSVAHAHQLWSQTAFERGSFGLAGLLLMLAGFTLASRCGRPAGWWLVALVVLLNLVDYTFWTTPVSYTLGAIAGLAGHHPGAPTAPTDAGPRRRHSS